MKCLQRRFFLLTGFGPDRPKLVSSVTKQLFRNGCNLEDGSMSILEGEFIMNLIFSVQGEQSLSMIRKKLASFKTSQSFQIQLRELPHFNPCSAPPANTGKIVRIQVLGPDKEGIVFRVSDVIGKQGGNILDLYTHLARNSDQEPGYFVLIEAVLGKGKTVPSLRKALKLLGKELELNISCQQIESHIF